MSGISLHTFSHTHSLHTFYSMGQNWLFSTSLTAYLHPLDSLELVISQGPLKHGHNRDHLAEGNLIAVGTAYMSVIITPLPTVIHPSWDPLQQLILGSLAHLPHEGSRQR